MKKKKTDIVEEDYVKLLDEYDVLPPELRVIYACVLMQVLNHLESNLDEAKGQVLHSGSSNTPGYRRREVLRTKVALRNIKKWINGFPRELV